MRSPNREFSSFRDPSGHLFWDGGKILRWVGASYAETFRRAEESGLLAKAIEHGLLLAYSKRDAAEFAAPPGSSPAAAILEPRQLDLITYPYEWSFGQLRDAALLTLDLHAMALAHGMVLKDASAFNVQFVDARPSFIDHLSFDAAEGHAAWPAYGQFCRHFLAPLLLMSKVDLSLGRMSELHLDGIPLDLASKLLPKSTQLSPAIQMHVHLHARMSQNLSSYHKRYDKGRKSLGIDQLKAIATSLRGLIEKLTPIDQKTEWGDYYSDTNYSASAFEAKKALIRDFIGRVRPQTLLDLGGNDGSMSRAVADLAKRVICADIDPRAVDHNYRQLRTGGAQNIMPLLADVTNPAPAIGFANAERPALFARIKADQIMALALIHHLAITNNLPLGYIARFLADQSPSLLIEFVPKPDSQVQRLLANRDDIFPDYTEAGFTAAFAEVFDIVATERIPGTERTLYLMQRHAGVEAAHGSRS